LSMLCVSIYAGLPFNGADGLYLKAVSHCGILCGIKDFPFYQPASFAVDYALRHVVGVPQPLLIRLAGMLLHGMSVFLFAGLLKRSGFSWRLAAVAALVFGLHPMALCAVMSAGGIAPLLSVLLFLAFFYQISGPDISASGETLSVAVWSLILLLFASDTLVAVSIFALFLLLRYFIRRGVNYTVVYGVYGALCAASAYMALLCFRAHRSSLLYGARDISPMALSARGILGFFNPFSCTPILQDAGCHAAWIFIAAILAAVLSYFALRAKKGDGLCGVDAGLSLAAGSVLGFFMLCWCGWGGKTLLSAEFLTYPLCAGLSLLLACALHGVSERFAFGAWKQTLLFSSIAIVCGLASCRLGPIYKNEVALWNHRAGLDGISGYLEAKALFTAGRLSEFDNIIDPVEDDAHRDKWTYAAVRALRGDRALLAGNAKAAAIFYDSSLAVDGSNYEALLGRGSAAYSMGNMADASKYYSRAASAEPALAQAFYDLGVLFERMGRYEEAVDSFRMAFVRSHDVFYLNARAEMEMARGSYAIAMSVFSESLEREPNQPNVMILMAVIYAREEKFEMTRILAQRAVNADPSNGVGYFVLAKGYAGLKMHDDALAALKKSSALNYGAAQQLLDDIKEENLDAASAARLILE